MLYAAEFQNFYGTVVLTPYPYSRTGTFDFVDALGTKREGNQKLFSVAAIRDGKMFQ
jgi:hypothetical protein